jgi:hypothetical protein
MNVVWCGVWFEFLTHKTTCTSEMLEKTTCRKICQKRPLRVVARLGRRHADAGRCMPPQPKPACGLASHTHLAAIPIAGKHTATMYKLCINFRKKKPHAGFGNGGRVTWQGEPPAKPHAGFGCGGMHLPQTCRHP